MKRGFTLIELLAVIVILAIIATIATPIVLSIIEDTKSSATLRSAEYYLDAVETSVATAILKNTNINDGTYKLKDGDICLDSSCTQILEVQIKGETPKSGTINIQDGNINDVTLFLDNKILTKSENNELVYTELEYEIGEPVKFNPGDVERTWNVIDEDATTVTLMLSENLGDPVAWYDYLNYDTEDTSNYGPKDALEDELGTLTTVEEAIEAVLEWKGENWVLSETKYMQTYYTVKWMISDFVETTYDILLPDYLYDKLYTGANTSLPYGYWTLSSYTGISNRAWRVYYVGTVNIDGVGNEHDSGVRPVITVSKSLTLQTIE